MNLSQSSTYLNTCFLFCSSSITFSAVEILWNMRIWWLKWLSSSFAGGGDIIINLLCHFSVTWNIMCYCWRLLVKEIGVFQSNYREKKGNIPFYFTRAQYGTWWWQFFVSNCKSHSFMFSVNIQGMFCSLLPKRCFWQQSEANYWKNSRISTRLLPR